MSYLVFICHGKPDRWIAKQIRSHLQTNGVSSFLDEADIDIGDNFRSAILRELDVCDELLVLFTPTSLNRAWIFAEIGVAILTQKRIVAVRYGVSMEELHAHGIVSLVGDVAFTDLDHLDDYIHAVTSRAEGRNDA